MQTKIIVFSFLAAIFLSPLVWLNDVEQAKQQASAEHKFILLNFSGSDWCGPCIKMHHDFFDDPDFAKMAGKVLVLVNADFPRQKKNQLGKFFQQQNDRLADKYNPAGIFPLTLLLDAKGNVVKTWEGYPKNGVNEFITNIKDLTHAAE